MEGKKTTVCWRQELEEKRFWEEMIQIEKMRWEVCVSLQERDNRLGSRPQLHGVERVLPFHAILRFSSWNPKKKKKRRWRWRWRWMRSCPFESFPKREIVKKSGLVTFSCDVVLMTMMTIHPGKRTVNRIAVWFWAS